MPLSFSKQHYGLYQRPYQGYDKTTKSINIGDPMSNVHSSHLPCYYHVVLRRFCRCSGGHLWPPLPLQSPTKRDRKRHQQSGVRRLSPFVRTLWGQAEGLNGHKSHGRAETEGHLPEELGPLGPHPRRLQNQDRRGEQAPANSVDHPGQWRAVVIRVLDGSDGAEWTSGPEYPAGYVRDEELRGPGSLLSV